MCGRMIGGQFRIEIRGLIVGKFNRRLSSTTLGSRDALLLSPPLLLEKNLLSGMDHGRVRLVRVLIMREDTGKLRLAGRVQVSSDTSSCRDSRDWERDSGRCY